MLNLLDNIAVVLFDFDDTLCIHTNRVETGALKRLNKIKLLNNLSCWGDCYISRHMKEFMNICKEKGIDMALCGGVESVVEAENKIKWVKDNYGVELKNLCVSTPEEKVEMAISLAGKSGIDPENVLMVDDWWYVLTIMQDNKVASCSPMYIVNYVEEIERCNKNEL